MQNHDSTTESQITVTPPARIHEGTVPALAVTFQGAVIALTAFLTLIDLFAIQAILPSLAKRYAVSPSDIGAAANACTLGMAVASLITAMLSRHIDRRAGIAISLALLAVPTAALGFVDNLTTFTLLRVLQGCLMATAFTLMLAYLGEHFGPAESARVFAAFITGNVLSNLAGRMLSASLADGFGVPTTFLTFSALNLLGAVLVFFTVTKAAPMSQVTAPTGSGLDAIKTHLRHPELRSAFLIGFLILFVFIGVFTYVNFILVAPPFSIGMMQLGFVYLVFLPSLPTTIVAGRIAGIIGARPALILFLSIAVAGLPFLNGTSLPGVLAGLVLVAVGTFAAQAVATGYVGQAAKSDRGAASGIYLAAYFGGGLVGSIILGRIFGSFGWNACLIALGIALLLAIGLAFRLDRSSASLPAA